MSIAEIKQTAEQKMQQSVDSFKNSLTKIRTGRANPGLLDTVQVDYYGSMVPISQVANVSLLDARTISVAPWEKGMGAKIEKAIRDSDLGLNPASQGDLIRVPMPAMTEERRKELTKVVRGEGEHARWRSAICAVTPTTMLKNWSRTSWHRKMMSAVHRMTCRNSPIVSLPK